MSSSYDHIVVGGGIMGVSAAYHLANAGREVALLEQHDVVPPPPASSSGDQTRIFRTAYGHQQHLSRLCQESLDWWRHIEHEAALNLLVPTDMVVFGADDVSALQRWANPSLAGWARASYETMRADGYECELLSRAALQARFTNLACDDRHQFAFIDHTAALIHASTAVRQIARLAHAAGATLLPYHTVEHVVRTGDDVNGLIVNGDRIVPRRGVIFAAGWQNSTLRPELAAKTRVTRQHIVRFRAQYGFRQPDGDLPIIVDLDDRRYLYALAGRTITVADDDSRPASKRVSDPSSSYGSPALDEAFVAEAHTFATTRVPELRGMTVLADTSCHYTSTVAGDYLVYQQGNVVVVSACSGHGFKNGPSIGRMAAEMAMKQRPRNYHPFYAFEHAQDIP